VRFLVLNVLQLVRLALAPTRASRERGVKRDGLEQGWCSLSCKRTPKMDRLSVSRGPTLRVGAVLTLAVASLLPLRCSGGDSGPTAPTANFSTPTPVRSQCVQLAGTYPVQMTVGGLGALGGCKATSNTSASVAQSSCSISATFSRAPCVGTFTLSGTLSGNSGSITGGSQGYPGTVSGSFAVGSTQTAGSFSWGSPDGPVSGNFVITY
jgi:hypothetical protein